MMSSAMATLEVKQMPSGGVSNVVQDVIMDNVTKESEIEAKVELEVEAMASENATDSLTMDIAKEAGTNVSLPAEEGGVGSGESQSVQVDPTVDLSKRLDTKINDGVNTNLNDSSEFSNAKEVEESLLESRALAQGAETTSSPDGTDVSSPAEEGGVGSGESQSVQVDPTVDLSKRLDTKINDGVNTSLNDSSEFSNAKEVEESLLESRALAQGAETTSNPDGMTDNLENLTVIQDSRKEVDRHRIAPSSIAEVLAAGVAEGIAESIAETIAKETAGSYGQGSLEGCLLDSGRFERMAIAKAVAEVIAEGVAQEVAQGLADGLAEVAAIAEASNAVEKRMPDNIQGLTKENKDGVLCECGLVAVVRVVGEKSPNRGLRYLMCSLQEPSFFKRKGKRKDSDTIGKCKFFRWLDTPRNASKENKKNQEKVKTQLEDLDASHLTRSSAKKSNPESPTSAGTRPSVDADRPTSAGTLTRSALKKGAPKPTQEPSLDNSAVCTPASALGKRTIDWTDSYVGPESQVFEKGATWRKRRSIRGESGPSSRYSVGGSGSERNTGFGSSEKKPLHYFRRSTGQIGASDGDTIPVLSSRHPVTDVESAEAGHKDEKDNRFRSYYTKGKVGSSLEPKSTEVISPDELEKKTKSQTRRQQRKLPLSEVYGAVKPLLHTQATKTGTTILVNKDNSLSPSEHSFGKSTASDIASEPKEAGLSKSPPKKRKLSWVLSEDSVMRETDSPKRSSARKSISSAQTNSESQIFSSSVIETPLVASVFPTVRYEAKLPVEDYHDPDDPWSLEIPWAKQEHQGEEPQQLEREKETSQDERNEEAEEGENIVMKPDILTRIEAVNEAAATEEEQPMTLSNSAQPLSVTEPGRCIGFETSGDGPGPVSSNMDLKEADGKDHDNSGPHVDHETINAVGNASTSLVDVVDEGENISLACTSQTGGAHPVPLADGQEVGNVWKEGPVETRTQHEVLHDERVLSDKTPTSMLAAYTGTPLEADGHESLMSETASLKVPGTIVESDHSAPDKIDSTAPSYQQLPFNEGADNLTNDSTHSVHVGEPVAEDANREENLEENLLIGSVPTVSKDSSSKLDDTVETDTILPCERSEPLGTLGDAEVTNEGEIVLSGDKCEIHGFQESVKRTRGLIEESAVSGSNLIGDPCPDARLGQGSDHEPERDLAHARLDQDAAFKSPREADHAGAAAASENAGFVNSVWRLASGKKTRSIGSIGAPAVTSKRSRSVVPSLKVGPKGDPKHQAEVQWVDVPLDWRNEKSTGRVPLLPNISGKGLNGSDTSQSDLRLLQSGDTSHGTHSARPRPARGEVDDSSIIIEEKVKELDACNEDSMDFIALITNGAAHGGRTTLASTEMDEDASVPAGEHYLGDPTNQEAVFIGGENAVQKRKRGRPRKDSKKPVGSQYAVAGGHKLGAVAGVNESPEPELAGVMGKADGEPSSMLICTTAMEGNTLTELHGEDRVSQLERSASNSERENGKPEGISCGLEECARPLDESDVPNTSAEGLHSEFVAPYCLCKVVPRQAILKTVIRSGDPNEGLRYWSCSNNRKLFTKKRKSPSDVTEESCNYFRWLDTPRFTAKDIREARKERYRQVELQRLL